MRSLLLLAWCSIASSEFSSAVGCKSSGVIVSTRESCLSGLFVLTSGSGAFVFGNEQVFDLSIKSFGTSGAKFRVETVSILPCGNSIRAK